MKRLKEKYVRLIPEHRLYHYERPIIALTGGIASGKSTVTKILESKGLNIIDADQLVKSIYQEQESKDFIKNQFPDAWLNDTISFQKLRELFFNDPVTKEKIEAFIYKKLPDFFIAATSRITDQDFYIYDVPLLFERKMENKVDLAITVYTTRDLQLARLIQRDGTIVETAKKILDHQMDIEEKKRKADFVIDNSGTLDELAAAVDKLLLQILN